jgi:hypothetical protein
VHKNFWASTAGLASQRSTSPTGSTWCQAGERVRKCGRVGVGWAGVGWGMVDPGRGVGGRGAHGAAPQLTTWARDLASSQLVFDERASAPGWQLLGAPGLLQLLLGSSSGIL